MMATTTLTGMPALHPAHTAKLHNRWAFPASSRPVLGTLFRSPSHMAPRVHGAADPVSGDVIRWHFAVFSVRMAIAGLRGTIAQVAWR